MSLIRDFMKTMLKMRLPWVLWVGALMGLNLAGPLFFIDRPEARVVLGAAGIGSGVMVAIFAIRGYVRLLGIGHILWLPMVVWLLTRDALSADTPYGLWLLAVAAADSLSLLIDGVDVWRYLRGERDPWIASGRPSG